MKDDIVKCQGKDGKFLFEWNPDENSIALVRKNTFYRLQLRKVGAKGTYRVLEQCPKNQRSNSPGNS